VPEPRVTGAWDILVQIGATGLCRTDLHIIEGQWADRSDVQLPYTLGHENAGWVREIGSAVTNVQPGDAVILHPIVPCGLCRPCRSGQDMHCESWCVVVGAGGLGHIGVQCLLAMTATTVVVIDRNEAALELVGRYGAHHLLPADGNQVQRVLDLTDGKGAHVVLDFVGEKGAEKEADAMTCRAGSGFVIGCGGTVEVPAIDLISTERDIVGTFIGTWTDLDELMALTTQRRVALHTTVYPLEAVSEAMDDLEAGRLRGRGILVPDA
jgi:NAD+-dependent secondary alcohol dehydrogenase Adh1